MIPKSEKRDTRTVDKLFQPSEPRNNRDCWLAPLCHRGSAQERAGITNSLFVLFRIPIVIGCIKVSMEDTNQD